VEGFVEVGNWAVIEAPFTLFDEQMEVLFGDAVIGPKAIGIDDGIGPYFTPDDWNRRLCGGILDADLFPKAPLLVSRVRGWLDVLFGRLWQPLRGLAPVAVGSRPVSRRPGRRLPLEAGMGPQVVIAPLPEPEFDPRMIDIHEQGFVRARVG